ncbi:MAG: sigma-70 family RNA polymerase sigma factor [Verrucomicrobiales bacterium]|jgi:RNA polymerase sigma-70 factor (ECF subfamily)|nr:sigma-70 family RNA polymerase sigma factor [Verrucomicrobiales bacterium]
MNASATLMLPGWGSGWSRPVDYAVMAPLMADPAEQADSDYALVLASQRGDDEAFAQLLRKYQPRVLQMAYRFAANDSDQEDLAQEIFIRLHQKLAAYRTTAPFEHWFMRLAHNFCRNWARRHRRYEKIQVDSTLLLEMISDTSHERTLSREEARQMLNFALDGLSPLDKIIVTLLELDEKSVREVAALTGLSEANVKVKAHRARRKMAKNLGTVYETAR